MRCVCISLPDLLLSTLNQQHAFYLHLADANKWRIIKIVSSRRFFFLPWFLIGKLDSCAIVCVPNAIISDRLPRLKELTKPFAISCRGKNWMNNESEWEEKISARRKIHLRLLNCRWLFISGKQLKFLLVLASNERANIQKKKLYPAVIWRRRFWLYQSSSAHFLYLSLGFVANCGCIRARVFLSSNLYRDVER